MTCRAARTAIVDCLREDASETLRLMLEAHLDGCAACRGERARWSLVKSLRHESPHLGELARQRVVRAMVATVDAARTAPELKRPAPWRALFAAGVLATTGAAAVLFFARPPPTAPVAALAEGAELHVEQAGRELAFAGSKIVFKPDTSVVFFGSKRTLALKKGEVDIDVTPGLPGRYRVTTSRFIVEVLGTRFVVTKESVRTLRGKVRVLDLSGHELALVVAGQHWDAPAELGSSAPPPAPPTPKELLDHARSALAQEPPDLAKVRDFLQLARAAQPTGRELASAGLVEADAIRTERGVDAAIPAYRRVVDEHPESLEGEQASYAIGQFLSEQPGRRDQARRALEDYLSRYPSGTFTEQARERLAQIGGGGR